MRRGNEEEQREHSEDEVRLWECGSMDSTMVTDATEMRAKEAAA